MFKKALLILAALVVLLLVAIAARPGHFTISRSAEFAAPPAAAFAQVQDFKAWAAWSPWDKLDPAMQRTYGAPSAGVGATYAWKGNDQVGEGKMTITEARAPEFLALDLEFLAPFPAKNRTEFTFEKAGEGTKVTWTMKGENGFVAKAFGMVMSMDQLVGRDFEQGLAAMKVAAEAQARQDAAAVPPAPEAAAAPLPEALDAGAEAPDAGPSPAP